jgi:hypothetical protein
LHRSAAPPAGETPTGIFIGLTEGRFTVRLIRTALALHDVLFEVLP